MDRSRITYLSLVLSMSMCFGLALCSGAGCGFAHADIDTVPDNPTFNETIKPILDDYCNLCHGAKPKRGAPHWFRLDSYDTKDGRAGAAGVAGEVLREIEHDSMPPAAAWGDGVGPKARRAIGLWVDHGAPQ